MKETERGETALRLPLLGTRTNYALFQYVLLDLTESSALISIPSWLVNRARLSEGEEISLHLNSTSSGTLTLVDTLGPDQLYRISFSNSNQVNWEPKEGLSQLRALLKDTFFLKKGVFIYLKHLVPYFSRIFLLSDSAYNDLKKLTLDDVSKHVQTHIQKLEELYSTFQTTVTKREEVPIYLDLEALRDAVQSELDIPFLELAFDNQNPLEAEPTNTNATRPYYAYLEAIKTLENRLYTNYNQIVYIYSESLA